MKFKVFCEGLLLGVTVMLLLILWVQHNNPQWTSMYCMGAVDALNGKVVYKLEENGNPLDYNDWKLK